MEFVFFEIIWGINAILGIICGIKVFRAYQETKSERIGDFAKFFLFYSSSLILFTLYHLILNLFFIKIFIIFGLLCLFLSLAYINKLGFNFISRKLALFVFWLTIIGNFLSFTSNLKYYLLAPGRLTPMALALQTKDWLIFLWSFSALTILIFCFLLGFCCGLYLIWQAISTKEEKVKLKAFFFGGGLFLFGFGGVIRGMGEVLEGFILFGDFIFSLATFLFLLTLLFKIKEVPKVMVRKPIPSLPIKW